MPYLLGIDIGTSACKAALFGEDGRVAAHRTAEYPVYYPRPGWAEQNPEDWWAAVCRAVRELLEVGAVQPADIAGIGVDGQSWSAVVVDGAGEILADTPIWMDTRAQDICSRWAKEIGKDVLLQLSGNPVKPSYTAPKVGWYREHRPEVYTRAAQILQSNSYIVYRLTGVFSQDKSQGYGWHCFDMQRCRWDREMCRQMGIDPALLPELYDCHAVVGGVTGEAAGQTGLLEGTPVVAGGLDAACGTLGAGVLHAGETQEQGGQAGGMSICLEEAKADRRLILSCHVVPGKWLLQGGTVGGGGVMRWLHREIGEAFSMRELDGMAEAVPPGSEGLIFLPYMAGERSPIWDEDAKGVLFGLDFSKTKAHIVRACLEGVAFSLRHNLDTAGSLGVETGTLKAMGGAANSPLWTQMKADVTEKRIEVPASDTATTLGAALLAGVGIGLYRDFEEAVGRTVAVQRVYLPQEQHQAAYDKSYQTYLKLYPTLKDLMKEG